MRLAESTLTARPGYLGSYHPVRAEVLRFAKGRVSGWLERCCPSVSVGSGGEKGGDEERSREEKDLVISERCTRSAWGVLTTGPEHRASSCCESSARFAKADSRGVRSEGSSAAQQIPRRYRLFERSTDFQEVAKSSPISGEDRPNEAKLGPGRPPVPIPLAPLLRMPRSMERDAMDENNGESSSGRQVKTQWQREVDNVEVPLIMPLGTGVTTGLEATGVVETLQAFAKVGKAYEQYGEPSEDDVISHLSEREQPTDPTFTIYDLPRTSTLPSYHRMSPVMRKIFPVKLRPTHREPVMPRPPRHETKLNPKTWRHPVRLTPRLVTRTYQRLWDELAWVRPQGEAVDGPWVKCSYEEVLLWQRKDWDALRNAANKRKAGFQPAVQARFSNMTPQEEYWTQHKKGRKSTKETITRLLDKRTRWDERD